VCGHLLQARGFFWRSSQNTPSADSGEEEDQDRFADRGAAYPLRLRLAARGRHALIFGADVWVALLLSPPLAAILHLLEQFAYCLVHSGEDIPCAIF
jgi:hypothetical protein